MWSRFIWLGIRSNSGVYPDWYRSIHNHTFERCPVRISVLIMNVLNETLRNFLQPFQENAGIVAQIKPRLLPSTSFTIHHSLNTALFNAICRTSTTDGVIKDRRHKITPPKNISVYSWNNVIKLHNNLLINPNITNPLQETQNGIWAQITWHADSYTQLSSK
jgi:hypothetical protein